MLTLIQAAGLQSIYYHRILYV